jgi:hypothetical protein
MERDERATGGEIADGKSLSQIGADFAAGGVLSPDLTQLAQKLDQLIRENLDLRRKLAAEEEAHSGTADRLDGAYQRIQELTEELAEALRQVELADQEFTNLRDAYARALNGPSTAPSTSDRSSVRLTRRWRRRPSGCFWRRRASRRIARRPIPPAPEAAGCQRIRQIVRCPRRRKLLHQQRD